ERSVGAGTRDRVGTSIDFTGQVIRSRAEFPVLAVILRDRHQVNGRVGDVPKGPGGDVVVNGRGRHNNVARIFRTDGDLRLASAVVGVAQQQVFLRSEVRLRRLRRQV